MNTREKINPNKTARIVGLLYIVPWVLSFLGVILRQGLIIPGDAAATAENIKASEMLFRISVVGDLIVQVVFVILVLLLYQLLKPVNKNGAALMVILFLISVPIAMLNMLNLLAVPLLVSEVDKFAGFTAIQLQSLIPFFLDLHEIGIMIAYIFWGLWLFPLGYLVFKSGFIPKILGILLMISCFGYLIDFMTFFMFPDFGVAINMYTGWAELFLCLWLLMKVDRLYPIKGRSRYVKEPITFLQKMAGMGEISSLTPISLPSVREEMRTDIMPGTLSNR